MSSSKDWVKIRKDITNRYYNIPMYDKHREILDELFKEKDGHFAYEVFDILNNLIHDPSDDESVKEFFWETLAEQILTLLKRKEITIVFSEKKEEVVAC